MSSPPSIATPAQAGYASPQVTVVLTIILLVFFFVGFFSVYFCRCFAENVRLGRIGRNSRPSANHSVASPGLDIGIIRTFPTFKYSAIKDLRKGEIGLECAICLSEFLNDDILRLLTFCCHVFHQECVDLWLETHKTCPVCRTALDTPPDEKSMPKVSGNNSQSPQNEVHHDHNRSDGSVKISVPNEESEIQITRNNGSSVRIFIEDGDHKTESKLEIMSKRRAIADKFSRCHSTGHSIFRDKVEDVEKYTLRLPEHVKDEITRGHQWAKSCTNFGEYSTNDSAKYGNGFGEMSGSSVGDAVDDKV